MILPTPSLSLSLSYDQNSKVLSPSGSLMTEEDDDGWMLLLMGQVKVSDWSLNAVAEEAQYDSVLNFDHLGNSVIVH